MHATQPGAPPPRHRRRDGRGGDGLALNDPRPRSHVLSSERADADLESDFAAVACVAAPAGSATPSTTFLHVGEQRLVVMSGQGGRPESVQRLDLGAARIAGDFFHHDPPTAGEIERAIDFVEDEIIRLSRPAETATTVWSMSPALQAWAAVSGPAMTIEVVEQWFQRLASAALGQPGTLHGLPAGRQAAATLLVLREFMHHRGHACIVALAGPHTPAV